MTDTQAGPHAFREITPAETSPEFDRFAASLRRFLDLAVGADADPQTWLETTEHLERLCAALEPHQAAQEVAPTGRATRLPGLGHPLLPPWRITEYDADGVTMAGHFTRYHVGGNRAVHGGAIPLFYDWHFGMIVSAAGRPVSRTAYLHVDYRQITPIDQPLRSQGHISEIDGRKAFVTATMTDAEGTVLSEASGLMIQLLPHQP